MKFHSKVALFDRCIQHETRTRDRGQFWRAVRPLVPSRLENIFPVGSSATSHTHVVNSIYCRQQTIFSTTEVTVFAESIGTVRGILPQIYQIILEHFDDS